MLSFRQNPNGTLLPIFLTSQSQSVLIKHDVKRDGKTHVALMSKQQQCLVVVVVVNVVILFPNVLRKTAKNPKIDPLNQFSPNQKRKRTPYIVPDAPLLCQWSSSITMIAPIYQRACH